MLSKRIIPCLDVKDGQVVKGVQFRQLAPVGDPVSLAARYTAQGADELVFYDITASGEGRQLFTQVLRQVARQVFIPLTVGGGITTLEDFDRVLKCGADKVSINWGALSNPALIDAAARRYGDQCVVLSMDVGRAEGRYAVFAKGGREDTGREAIAWAREARARGAGELVVNSIDTDGVRSGFDLELLAEIAAAVDIPIIASGGAGSPQHFAQVLALPGIDAALAASVFHRGEIALPQLKAMLAAEGIPVRLTEEARYA